MRSFSGSLEDDWAVSIHWGVHVLGVFIEKDLLFSVHMGGFHKQGAPK